MKTILAVNELTPQKKKGIMFVVFILGLVQNFSSNMFNTTGTAIVAQLSGVEYYTLQFTIFTLVSGIFIPMFGNLGDIQGRRRWLAIGAALFVVGSLTMCAAPTMLVILIGRVIVSVAQAIMSGNYLTLIGEISNEKERPMFMTINGAGIGVAMMLAPILAGYFVDKISWRMVFLFLTVISAIAMILVFAMIPTIKTPAMEQGKKKTPDWGGGLTIAIFGMAFLLAFTWGNSKGWGSPTLIALYVVAVIALIAFISCEKKGSNPLMPFHLFKYRGFTLGLIAMVAYGPACYSFSTYTAQIGVGVLGLSSTHTGTFLAVHAIGYLIFNFVWGKLISAKGPRALKPVQLICLLGLAISMIILTASRQLRCDPVCGGIPGRRLQLRADRRLYPDPPEGDSPRIYRHRHLPVAVHDEAGRHAGYHHRRHDGQLHLERRRRQHPLRRRPERGCDGHSELLRHTAEHPRPGRSARKRRRCWRDCLRLHFELPADAAQRLRQQDILDGGYSSGGLRDPHGLCQERTEGREQVTLPYRIDL